MPTPPTLTAVKTYLGTDHGFTDAEIRDALATETAAQARIVFFPLDPLPPAAPLPYPVELGEALMRRVQRNLSMRQLPLGYQTTAYEFGPISTRIGSDPEVARLESSWTVIVVS